MKERTSLSVKLIFSHLLLLPLLLAASLLINGHNWLLFLVIQTLCFIILLAGYWEFFGLKFRIIFAGINETLILAAIFIKIHHSVHSQSYLPISILAGAAELILLYELVKIVVVIFRKEAGSMEIAFPLKNGIYMITDGGNSKLSRLMNYHYYSQVHRKNNTNSSMKYATDIVKIDSNQRSFLPPHNEDYPIFDRRVYSPVSGTVIIAENDIADNIPYSGNYPYNTGNTVVIKSNNYYLLAGHLMKSSLKVKTGDTVAAGEWIASAGNSGFSERPHIHMQMIQSPDDNFWRGTGVAISFEGKGLYKNRIIYV